MLVLIWRFWCFGGFGVFGVEFCCFGLGYCGWLLRCVCDLVVLDCVLFGFVGFMACLFAGLLTAVSSRGIVVWLCVFVFAFRLLLICLFGYALCLVGLPLAGCGFGGLHLAGGWVSVGVWLVFDCCR